MSLDPARLVLSAIIPNRRDLLSDAQAQLELDHFREPVLKNLYSFLLRYYDKTSEVMPEIFLSAMLKQHGVDPSKILLYEEIYRQLAEAKPADHEFRYAIRMLKDDRAEQLTGEAITTAFEILQRGTTIDRRDWKGHSDARQFIYSELAHIDKLNNAEQAPEGFLHNEKVEILQDYAKRKAGKANDKGIKTGIGIIDRASGGFQPGELILVCAYTGEGKSMLSTQIAWHACYQQGKNVFFATSETIRPQVMRRLHARHSRLPQFGFPEGLNSSKIKNGTLTQQEESVYQAVLDDIESNKTYGKMYIAQIPQRSTLGFLEARLSRQSQLWDVDLVIIDYLALLKPDQKRQVAREELNDILKDCKSMAVSHAEGRGVPVISPWAMSQSAYREALNSGVYGLANLADTSEAEKSSDEIWSMLRFPNMKDEVKMQSLKMRDGDPPASFTLETAYHCAYLGEKQDVGSSLLNGNSGSNFNGLLFDSDPFGT
jgi:replicative DNA helicase